MSFQESLLLALGLRDPVQRKNAEEAEHDDPCDEADPHQPVGVVYAGPSESGQHLLAVAWLARAERCAVDIRELIRVAVDVVNAFELVAGEKDEGIPYNG